MEGDIASTIVGVKKLECFFLPHSEDSMIIHLGIVLARDRRTVIVESTIVHISIAQGQNGHISTIGLKSDVITIDYLDLDFM